MFMSLKKPWQFFVLSGSAHRVDSRGAWLRALGAFLSVSRLPPVSGKLAPQLNG
jgi:hypothetical protein